MSPAGDRLHKIDKKHLICQKIGHIALVKLIIIQSGTRKSSTAGIKTAKRQSNVNKENKNVTYA